MGCCDFELLEMSVYRMVLKVKNQHRDRQRRPYSLPYLQLRGCPCICQETFYRFQRQDHLSVVQLELRRIGRKTG